MDQDLGDAKALRSLEESLGELQGALESLADELIAVPSVGGTPAEAHVQHLVAAWLSAHGLTVDVRDVAIDRDRHGFPGMEVDRDSVVRVEARLKGCGTGPDLLFVGHTDVVPATGPAAFAPVRRDGRLYGRGAADMKAGVAAMCVAAAAIARSRIRLSGDLVVAPVSAEEDGGAGTFALLTGPDPLRLRPDGAAIIPEPSAARLVVANAGSLTFRITLTGRSAHGALRWHGVSAIERLPVILDALRDLEAARCREAGPLFAHLPLAYPISIGTIAGGDWASTVPGEVVLAGRYGVRLGEPVQQARATLEAAVARAAGADPWLRDHPPVVEWWGAEFSSAVTDPEHRVVRALRTGGAGSGAAIAAPYGSDMRLLVGLAGIPTVIFGPGSPHDAHTDGESVRWSDVRSCARTLARAAVRYCQPEPVENPGR